MAVLASAVATLLHEGVGHGLTAWFRGDIPTELTSNHLSSMRPDRWVDSGGTLVNLFAGTISLLASRVANSANLRYFLWILAALNLLPGAGYFLFSGIFGFGDWQEVIRGLPYQGASRIALTILGIANVHIRGAPPRGGGAALLPTPTGLQRRRAVTVPCRVPFQLRCRQPRPPRAEALPCVDGSGGIRRVVRPSVGGQSVPFSNGRTNTAGPPTTSVVDRCCRARPFLCFCRRTRHPVRAVNRAWLTGVLRLRNSRCETGTATPILNALQGDTCWARSESVAHRHNACDANTRCCCRHPPRVDGTGGRDRTARRKSE